MKYLVLSHSRCVGIHSRFQTIFFGNFLFFGLQRLLHNFFLINYKTLRSGWHFFWPSTLGWCSLPKEAVTLFPASRRSWRSSKITLPFLLETFWTEPRSWQKGQMMENLNLKPTLSLWSKIEVLGLWGEKGKDKRQNTSPWAWPYWTQV